MLQINNTVSDFKNFISIAHIGVRLQSSLELFYVHKFSNNVHIHFNALNAEAFFCIQAKQVLGLFSKTIISVKPLPCTETLSRNLSMWNAGHTENAKIIFAEKYCIKNADILVLSSLEDLNTLKSLNYELANNVCVVSRSNSIVDNDFAINKINFDENSSCADSKLHNLLSVCISYYNHGAYLSAALQSISDQEYINFEVIVVDSGSTDVISQQIFVELSLLFDKRFKFFQRKNESLGATRNFCVSQAKGEYIVFCDSDNIFMPHMLSTFAKAIVHSGCDALSCHNLHFVDKPDPDNPAGMFVPIGPDIVTGLLENVFGDSNFIIKKSVFLELGGFCDTRHGCEDWEFLARLSLAGYKLDVIPEPLYWYRLNPNGMHNTVSRYHSHQLVFSAYRKYLPQFAEQAIEKLLLPMFCGHSASNAVIIRSMLRLGIKLEEMYLKLFPAGSRMHKLISSFWRGISSIFKK